MVIRNILTVLSLLVPMVAYGSGEFRYFSISQFTLDYYASDHSLWLVEYDTFALLRASAENEAKKRNHSHALPEYSKHSTVTTNLAFGKWTIKYIPIKPIELVALLPYLKWNGIECRTNPGTLEIMADGRSIQIGGVCSYQIYRYILDIINQIEEQGLSVLA